MKRRPPRYDLHASPGYHATLAARVYERRLEEGLRAVGLSRISWCILLAVAEEGLRHPSEIAAFIGIGRSVASRALGQLEREGLIARQSGTGDRRTTEVRATPEGLVRLEAALPVGQENCTHFSARLSTEERETLIALLDRLRAGDARPLARF